MSQFADLEKLLEELPVEGARVRPDLFSIAGFPHYEDVLSNWYAFFMDADGPHMLGTLFLDVLLELRQPSQAVATGRSLSVKREQPTKKGKAIDLVLHDGVETDKGITGATNAVIIENKVYHSLVNDLTEYWDSIEADNRVGIILCLKPSPIGHAEFGAVTHRSFIDAVVDRLPITAPIPEPYRQYLIDLHQNVHELTTHMEYSNEVDFFLKNAERIQRVNRLEGVLKDYLKGQLEPVAAALNVRLYPSAQKCWYLCLPKDDPAYYSVLLDDVLGKGSDLLVAVELHGTEEKNLDDFFTAVEPLLRPGVHADKPLHNQGANWVQYATIRIPMSTAARGELSATILQRIQQDLAPILAEAKRFMARRIETS